MRITGASYKKKDFSQRVYLSIAEGVEMTV